MLKGKKILLRNVEKKDVNILHDILSDEEVRKYDCTFIVPPSKEWILENFNEFKYKSKKYLSVINEKGVLTGYMTYKEEEDSPNVYSIGITLDKKFWNRGYGQDAIKTLLKFLFMSRAAQRVELEVAEYNKRAIKCYKNCGFVEEGVKRERIFSDGKYEDVMVMGIIITDFKDIYS